MEGTETSKVIHRIRREPAGEDLWLELWLQACGEDGWRAMTWIGTDHADLDWPDERLREVFPGSVFALSLAVLWTHGGFVVPFASYPVRSLEPVRRTSRGFVTSFDGPYAMMTTDFMGCPQRCPVLADVARTWLDRGENRLHKRRLSAAEALTMAVEHHPLARVLPSFAANPSLDTLDVSGNYIVTQ
jgi:hypothetical protein